MTDFPSLNKYFQKKASKYLFVAILLVIFVFFVLVLRGVIEIPSTVDFGFFSIKLYGLIIGIALLIWVSMIERSIFEVERRIFFDILPWVLISALIGARIWHFMTDFSSYAENIVSILYIWNGGLSIFGAILGGLLAFLFVSRKYHKKNTQHIFSKIVVFLPLAQVIGRLGNFVNQELFGSPTNLPWGVFISFQNRPAEYSNFLFFHPAFLYEMIGNLILFLILLKIDKNGKSYQKVLSIYLVGYGLVRIFVSFFRQDSQIVSFVSIITSIIILLLGLIMTIHSFLKTAPKKAKEERVELA